MTSTAEPTTKKQTKKPTVETSSDLECKSGKLINIARLDAFGTDNKPNRAAFAKCPRLSELLKDLRRRCNGKDQCSVPRAVVRVKSSECSGVRRLHVQVECNIPSKNKPGNWIRLNLCGALVVCSRRSLATLQNRSSIPCAGNNNVLVTRSV